MVKKLDLEWILTDQDVSVITRDLVQLRLEADLKLVPQIPDFMGKTYPQGRCKEIRDEVFDRIQLQIHHTSLPGLKLIRDRLAQGDSLFKVWGSLRDVYFQNAMIMGGWYFDVANDTVNPNKPRIEILPLHESGFSLISSFRQFSVIAKRYWKVEVYQNTVCPELAPFLPFVFVDKERKRSWIGEASNDMLAVATNSKFQAVIDVWSETPPIPEPLLSHWNTALESLRAMPFLTDKGQPLALCQHFAKLNYHQNNSVRDQIIMAFLKVPKLTLQ